MILLDDLQWSDDATLELLGALADPLRELPILVVGAYRSDEVPRAHPLRGLRNELRRARALRELALEPLDADGTGGAGRARSSAAPLSPALARTRLRPHPGRPVLRRGARRRAGLRRAADRGRARPRARRQRRDPGARDDPRRGAPARRRAVGRGARRRRGRVGRPARASTSSSWPRSAATPGWPSCSSSGLVAETEPGARRLPPRARPRRDLRGRPVAAAPRRCTGAWPRRSRPRGGAGRRGRRRTGSPRARRPRALDALLRAARRARRRCTPTATRPAPRGARSSCGPTASARASASRCSSATRAARSSPAT